MPEKEYINIIFLLLVELFEKKTMILNFTEIFFRNDLRL